MLGLFSRRRRCQPAVSLADTPFTALLLLLFTNKFRYNQQQQNYIILYKLKSKFLPFPT